MEEAPVVKPTEAPKYPFPTAEKPSIIAFEEHRIVRWWAKDGYIAVEALIRRGTTDNSFVGKIVKLSTAEFNALVNAVRWHEGK